jgi:hypothetical protein
MMNKSAKPTTSHFTAFHSAAAEVARASAKNRRATEGSHMHAKSGRIVQVSHDHFKVVLTHEDGSETEQPCATMRDGEATIRRNTPTPPQRDASRDQTEIAPGQTAMMSSSS